MRGVANEVIFHQNNAGSLFQQAPVKPIKSLS
jgi:hypothetical protein